MSSNGGRGIDEAHEIVMSTGAPISLGSVLAVFDIDGVVADVRHRLHHLERHRSWHAFFAAAADDPLLPEGARLVADLAARARDRVVVRSAGVAARR